MTLLEKIENLTWWNEINKLKDILRGLVGSTLTTEIIDISDSATIVGWASYTRKKIYLIKIGKNITVHFDISGESNSTLANITLPFSSINMIFYNSFYSEATDEGQSVEVPNLTNAVTIENGNFLVFGLSNINGSWFDSRIKTVTGQINYITN